MDEFGRGTTEEEGISLLVGAIEKFLERNKDCPHLVVSTHFQQIVTHLPKTSLIQYLKMDHVKEEKDLCFLYKVTEGKLKENICGLAKRNCIDSDQFTILLP